MLPPRSYLEVNYVGALFVAELLPAYPPHSQYDDATWGGAADWQGEGRIFVRCALDRSS